MTRKFDKQHIIGAVNKILHSLVEAHHKPRGALTHPQLGLVTFDRRLILRF